MGSKSDYLEGKVLDHVLAVASMAMPAAVYSALFTVAPSDSTAGTEVTVGAYTRLATTFVTSSGGSTNNATAKSFATAATAYTIIGWGLLDAATQGVGNLLYYTTVTTVAIGVGDQPTIAASAITITED